MGLTTQEYINFLQRYIIVHSYIYYELNDNVISDRQYDAKSKELMRYKNDYPELWKSSEYYKQFGEGYSGATGFTFYHDLNDRQKEIIRSIAFNIRRTSDYKKPKTKTKKKKKEIKNYGTKLCTKRSTGNQ